MASPSTGTCTSWGDEWLTDSAAIIGPAGAVFPVVEVVVEAAVDVVFVVVRIGGVEVLLFFVGGRATVIGAGLFLCVLKFIQDVGHPAVFVVGAEPESVNAIGPILDAGHAGAIVVRYVALKCGFPAVAAPINAEEKAAALVTDHIVLVGQSACCRSTAAGYHAEIVPERNGHHAIIGACAAPNSHVV